MTDEKTLYPPAPKVRIRRLALWIAVGVIGVLAVEVVYVPWQRDYLAGLTDDNALPRIQALMIAMAVVVMAVAGWVGVSGLRILKLGCHPLPGTFVWRPTPIHTGPAARLRGIALILWALAALAFAAWVPFVFPSLANQTPAS